jgi:hypothetical protein
MPGYNEVDEGSGDSGDVVAASGPSKYAVKKLDQIIQVYAPPGLHSSIIYL